MTGIDQRCRSALQLLSSACRMRDASPATHDTDSIGSYIPQAGHHEKGEKEHHRPRQIHLLKRQGGSHGVLVTITGSALHKAPRRQVCILLPSYMLNSLFLPTFYSFCPSIFPLTQRTIPIPSFSAKSPIHAIFLFFTFFFSLAHF